MRDLETLLDNIGKTRSLKVNFKEMMTLIEFFFLHSTEFKVTEINEEEDSCKIRIID